jgi:hypothetical protein
MDPKWIQFLRLKAADPNVVLGCVTASNGLFGGLLALRSYRVEYLG